VVNDARSANEARMTFNHEKFHQVLLIQAGMALTAKVHDACVIIKDSFTNNRRNHFSTCAATCSVCITEKISMHEVSITFNAVQGLAV
jgi:hypothetical protein